MSRRILVVDDEPDVLELVRVSLVREGFEVDTAECAAEAFAKVADRLPELMVLDLMLPDMSGTEICRRLRSDPVTADIPVVMLTARSEEVDRVVGFELGADDYVTKPFSPRELALRIKAVLRRSEVKETTPMLLEHGSLTLDLDRHRCTVEDNEIELTPKEFNLLESLMERRGRVQSRERLLEECWGTDIMVTHRTVDTHMKRLREKLGPAGDYIDTVRGIGYRFVD
ncbi:MAG: two-component system phosphate regulon response regulator PhoB [Myxococcota bacterium]